MGAELSVRDGLAATSVHELFERRVERVADRVALRWDHQHLSFATLNARANRLARVLRAGGAGLEKPIGICIESSFDGVIAVVATFKAGAAYVPLPPALPVDRVARIVEASGLAMVVTTSSTAKRFEQLAVTCVCVDRPAGQAGRPSPRNLSSMATLDSLALVRYTSGSTGAPKGVMLSHGALLNRVLSGPLPDIVPDDVCGVGLSLGFGPRLLSPLVLGATVVIIPDDRERDPALFVQEVAEQGVTVVSVVPSFLRKLLELPPQLVDRLTALRAIVVGGEALAPDLQTRCAERLPGVLLFDVYGATEIGGYALIRSVAGTAVDRPPFDVSSPNARVHVLDDDGVPVRAGQVGNLAIASDHLARGYLGQPAATAERFVPDPFREAAGSRLYRTGDIGRCLDGNRVEFIGRLDEQVKVGGMRVEPREVEAALFASGKVHDAVVVAATVAHQTRLIAYVVVTGPLRITDLRDYLQARLPAYMIPSTFVRIERLPVLSNGKLDRAALPPPSAVRPDLETPYDAPRDDLEAVLSEVWAAALGIDRVGVQDNFLRLGGDSLIAMSVAAAIRERLGREVAVASLFKQPTVAMLAHELRHDSAPAGPCEVGAQQGVSR
jgi:amino acid adenylation domain-containing protein